ncbi:MAG: FKBP-type peptidyl-prolyl cis-trans isomerase [Planctomycetales bacterium]|nr:FKBP-type peptidyl-prolyl cis-trans isomerase [Planctomycetales bacterium]
MKFPWLLFSSLVVSTALIGCTDDAKPVRPEAPIPMAPALPPERPVAAAAEPGPPDLDAPTEFTETETGLKYRILRKSDGRQPKRTDTVTVNYRGWRDDGKVFDSSYKNDKPEREPTTFPLSGVIGGWTEGLQLVGEGGMIELEIPAALGYGERGSPPHIPPGATLHFIVELLKIK